MFTTRVDEGVELPRFYGVAWTESWRRQAVCALMPFCFVLRFAYWLYWGVAIHWFRAGSLEARLEKRLNCFHVGSVERALAWQTSRGALISAEALFTGKHKDQGRTHLEVRLALRRIEDADRAIYDVPRGTSSSDRERCRPFGDQKAWL